MTVEATTYQSNGIQLTGNLMKVPGNTDCALLVHGAAAKGDPLPAIAQIQQFMSIFGTSTFALRMPGVMNGTTPSEGEYTIPLSERIVYIRDGIDYLRDKSKCNRCHLLGASMHAHTCSLAAQELNHSILSVSIVEGAAYPPGAENVPLGDPFSRIIKNTTDTSLRQSSAFKALDEFRGKIMVGYGALDDRIPDIVKHEYRRYASENCIFTIPEIGHELVSNTSHVRFYCLYERLVTAMSAC